MVPISGRHGYNSFDHGCCLAYVQRITSIEFRRDFAVGRSSHRRVESGSTCIALSSGEAELYAGMRRFSETLGFAHMMREFKIDDWGRIVHRVYASACRAILLRRGCGGLKHSTVKSLWVQEAVLEYSIETERISRDEMHAHILASPSSAQELRNHLTEVNAFRSLESEEADL